MAIVLAICPAPTPALAQAPRASARFGHGPDTIPDVTNRLVAVYGNRPLSDSALVMLARRGLRVTDRNPQAIEQAQRQHRRLDAAQIAVVVEVRYDSMARSRIIVASLLDVMTLRRVRLSSALLPANRPWGPAMDTVLTQLLARGDRR
ncbi:MAG TPA: hypothetical protein VGI83_09215 [Gemmatimonadales bacterium]